MVKSAAGPVFVIFGLVVGWVGFSMWRSPHLDWDLFLDEGWGALVWLWDEVARMVDDPLAWIGLCVMAVGFAVLIVGAQRVKLLIFGR